jgi:hypothetical protein
MSNLDKHTALLAADLKVGTKFSTVYDPRCEVLTLPDEFGNFEGLDTDGVRVEFNLTMIVNVER